MFSQKRTALYGVRTVEGRASSCASHVFTPRGTRHTRILFTSLPRQSLIDALHVGVVSVRSNAQLKFATRLCSRARTRFGVLALSALWVCPVSAIDRGLLSNVPASL